MKSPFLLMNHGFLFENESYSQYTYVINDSYKSAVCKYIKRVFQNGLRSSVNIHSVEENQDEK